MLLNDLIEKQIRLRMTDDDFSRRMGISRQLWQMTRTEIYAVNFKVVRGAARAFPDLADSILDFLRSDASELATGPTGHADEPDREEVTTAR